MRDKHTDYADKLTDEQKEWLKNFDEGVIGREKKKLEKICTDPDSVTRILTREESNRNSERRDIMNKHVRIRPKNEHVEIVGIDEAFNDLLGNPNLDFEADIPRLRDDGNYTPEDYMGNEFPTEDTLIAMIDYDRVVEEAKKIKSIAEARKKRGNKNG